MKRKTPATVSRRTAPSPAELPLPGMAPLSDRHREVLRAAMDLFAERGFGGASLRELARRLDVSQPSLYHYFESKEQLLDQVITFCGTEIFMTDPMLSLPDTLAEIPETVVQWVVRLYDNPRYVVFVRFLFAIAAERPEAGEPIRALYADHLKVGAAFMLQPFVERGEIARGDAVHLLRMLTNAIGLLLIEKRVLYRDAGIDRELREFAGYIARIIRAGLTAPGPPPSAAAGPPKRPRR